MLRTLVFAGIAAYAGRKLYKSGAIDRFSEDLKKRTDELRAGRSLGSTASDEDANTVYTDPGPRGKIAGSTPIQSIV